ncbi:MAG: hypothetical protein IJU95_04660, partial [Treponema sp.]|nr:hypothetical protein [Treponema sp.]
SEDNERKLKKKLAGQEEKIAQIEKQIRQNLEDTRSLKARYGFEQDASEQSVVEEITLLDSDAFSLLEIGPGQTIDGLAKSKGLSGLISGSIESFGDFVSVTAELRCYPGARSVGTVTELGELDELSEIADNLLVALIPKIANTMPVQIHFSISPEEALASCQVFIDGILLNEGADEATVSYGEHKLEICADGYFTRSLSYSFTESTHYSVAVPLEKKGNGTFPLSLLGAGDGIAYANAKELDGGRTVTINGKPVLGRFISDAGGISDSYYYVAPELQQNGTGLSVNLKERPMEDEINIRRIWSYRGYSALMLTLPAAFLAYGNYMEVKDGFRRGGELQGSLDNAFYFSNAATALSVVAGGFFIWQLIRYVHTVSGILPQEAVVQEPAPVSVDGFRKSVGEEQEE